MFSRWAGAVAVFLTVISSSTCFSMPQSGGTDTSRQASGPHVGTAEQALVGLEVINTSHDGAAQQARRGDGVVIRCDGFVLAPLALFSYSMRVAGQPETAGRQSISVILSPGTPREQRIEGRRPRFTGKDVDYAVIKLDDIHAPAVRTLLPDTLRAGDPVVIVSSGWDPDTGRYRGIEHTQARLASPSEEDVRQGAMPFAEPLRGTPAGSVVVGPGGMCVGIIPGTGVPATSPRMLTISMLDRVTNCITPVPTAEPLPAPEASDVHFSPMVSVPGGRMFLCPALVVEQPDMESTALACIAPFEIDQYEVTNEEYLAYWNTIPAADRRRLGFRNSHYPTTWAPFPAPTPFPSEMARMPVLGVGFGGATGYAHWRGKRLPTPYEWALAAFGPKGDSVPPPWVGNYVRERRLAWDKIVDLHTEFLRQHGELRQNGVFLNGPFRLPWIAQLGIMQEATKWSKETINTVMDEVWNFWKDPFYVRQVGSRDYDTSPYGAMDMLMNAYELVAPNPGPPALGSLRYMRVTWEPAKAEPGRPWTLQPLQVMTGDAGLPPLSRLYRRETIGPSADDILLWSSLNEITQLLWPLAGLRLTMGRDTVAYGNTWIRGQNPYGDFAKPAGYKLWTEIPHHFRREMGLEVPLNEPETHALPAPQLNYYMPVGFRCAR